MIGLGQKRLRDVIVPKFDRRSLSFYLLLAASILFVWLCLALTGIDVSHALQFDTALWACVAIVIATMLRRVGHERLSTGIETIALIIVMAVVLVGIQYPLAAVSGPLVDAELVRADRAIGFDWLTFARLFRDPVALAILKWAYLSMSWQAAFVLAFLAWHGKTTRSWKFVTATFILFLAATLPFFMFPADGRFVLCGLRPADIPVVSNFCDYAPILHQLREGTLRVIEPSMAVGMVTFPSAHTAAGLLLTWAVWPYRWLRWPFAMLNAALAVGAIVVGSHYLVDIIAGLAIGVVSIWLAGKLIAPAVRAREMDAAQT